MVNKLLFYSLLLLGAGLVLYLSWQSHPKMATDWFIPAWVASWADKQQNDTLRTAVPFVALGWLLGGWLAFKNSPWRQWLLAWAGLVALVSTAEVGQLFRADRSFDLKDIGWGAAGALLGLGTVAALWGLRQAVKLARRRP
ncbi:VanZ family protein [Hymenobacter sp. RP-2-7]|uniref:VanZ family protein n=1 Tax=Hymenobacter polaris TaxID=2682546 RepID=A0A7Y0FNK8_9BACT|nr:VanZ family protein [Hymenobacter polaris]NML66600.1 VanZ family protein [Hymenobacter polaris]